MNGLAFYVKEGLSFALNEALENSVDSYLYLRLPLLHSVSYFFFHYRSLSSSLSTVFDSSLSSIDEVLSINPVVNVFVFGFFDVHHKDWLTYSGGTNRPCELRYNFYLKQPNSDGSLSCSDPRLHSQSLALLDFFVSSDASISSTMAFPTLGNSDHLLVSIFIDFSSNSRRDVMN